METYSFLREFADSWMLLLLFSFFVSVWLWVMRPGSNKVHDEAKTVVLRNDDSPSGPRAKKGSL